MTADGTQCTRRAWTTLPTVLTGDGHTYTYGRDVPLCAQHNSMHWRRRRKSRAWRMQLIHGGWLGCYNQYGFGTTVTAEPFVDWGTVPCFAVPRYWCLAEVTDAPAGTVGDHE